MKNKTSVSRPIVYYAVFLLLSLLILTSATTVLVTVVFVSGSVSIAYFIIFLVAISLGLVTATISLRGFLAEYTRISSQVRGPVKFTIHATSEMKSTDLNEKHTRDPSFFTGLENRIIELLEENGNRMLQSQIVERLGISKVAVSRGVGSLEKKGMIVRLRKGVTNEVILGETG